MTLATLIAPDRVFVRLAAADKPALLGELGKRAAAALGMPPADIADALQAREALGSTGVGGGIAVPHARIAGVDAVAGFFARLARPLAFAAIDGKPVDLVFLLISPPSERDPRGAHLAALAAMTRRLRDRDVAQALRGAATPAALWASLVGETTD